MKLQIIHLAYDDKFIDGALSLFNADDRVENRCIIIRKEKPLKYIKSSCVSYVDKDAALNLINNSDVVIIHSLPTIPLSIVSKIRKETKVVWFAWGYDIYTKPLTLIPLKLFGPVTKQKTRYFRFRSLISRSYVQSRWNVIKYIESVLSRIDYFSGVFPYEIELLKKCHPEFKAASLDFYYGSTDFFISDTPPLEIKHGKKNVIVGNSADMTNNHLDVLKILSTIDIDKDSKIIIPLSYSYDYKAYVKKVEDEAEKIAPGQIVSLRTYLPFDEYIKLISNCRTAVFAHERQQASDNIFLQMIYGARVYMSETSDAYSYLKSMGLKVYSLQNEIDLFNIEMTDEDVMINREILSSLYSTTKLIERVKKINTQIINDLGKN